MTDIIENGLLVVRCLRQMVHVLWRGSIVMQAPNGRAAGPSCHSDGSLGDQLWQEQQCSFDTGMIHNK